MEAIDLYLKCLDRAKNCPTGLDGIIFSKIHDIIKIKRYRHHLQERVIEKAIRSAAIKSGILKRIRAQTFRHSFAIHLLESVKNIRVVQGLLGHNNIETTMIYTCVVLENKNSIKSPLDNL